MSETREQLIARLRLDPQFEELEGVFIDTDSGEIIELPEPESVTPLTYEQKAEIAAETLQRMTRLDGRIVGLTAEKTALIAAIEKNVGGQLKKVQNVRERIEKDSATFLEEFAKEAVAKKNEGKPLDKWKKFWECAFGRLSFKAYAGKISVPKGKDEDALKWCKTNAPGAIHRKVVLTIDPTDIDEETRVKWLKGEEEPPEVFAIEKQTDRFYVNTNVKA